MAAHVSTTTTITIPQIGMRRSAGEPTRLERWTAPWRALPNLLVIGAQKSGTTSLHEFLAGHPEIRMSRIKECHVLWKADWNLRQYRAFFPPRSKCRAPAVKHVGDSTPYYLFHPTAAISAQRLDTALRAEGRTLRAIVVLRDPVERAWSQYQHARRQETETLSFAEALAAEEVRLTQGSFSYQHHSYQARGRYAEQLERWFAALGRGRILVLEFRELLAMDLSLRERLRKFLELEAPFEGDMPRSNAGKGERIPEELRTMLEESFVAPNRALEQLLGVRYPWIK